QRRRHGEREGDRDRREQREVVEREPCGGGDAMPREPVDAGPQRGGDDHRREQEADDEPQLPEREADDDDRTRDERCDCGSACGLHHGANRSRCVDYDPCTNTRSRSTLTFPWLPTSSSSTAPGSTT